MCAAWYALSNACMGASPVAYATDVMPTKLGGFGLGMYRCAGDIGRQCKSIHASPVTPTSMSSQELNATCSITSTASHVEDIMLEPSL